MKKQFKAIFCLGAIILGLSVASIFVQGSTLATSAVSSKVEMQRISADEIPEEDNVEKPVEQAPAPAPIAEQAPTTGQSDDATVLALSLLMVFSVAFVCVKKSIEK